MLFEHDRGLVEVVACAQAEPDLAHIYIERGLSRDHSIVRRADNDGGE